MKTELIQALSNANINSDSAEIIASEYIGYLYFSSFLDAAILIFLLFGIVYFIKVLIRLLDTK